MTSREHDSGFPIFQRNNDNLRYTCIVNRDLEIIEFNPVIVDSLFFIANLDRKFFDIGTIFSHMLFRDGSQLYVVDIRDLNQVDAAVARFGDDSYVSLQVFRGVSGFHPEYVAHARRSISKVAKFFAISERNRLKFISSEISLLSSTNNIWESAENIHSNSETISSIYARYAKMSKHDLEILIAGHPEDNPYWCYIFVTYYELFGSDEFLYDCGKDFVKKIIFDQAKPTKIEAQIIKIMLEFHLEKAKISIDGKQNYSMLDEEIFTLIDDLMASDAFLEVIIHYYTTVDLIGDLFRRRGGVVDATIELLSLLERFRHRVPESVRQAISRYLDRAIVRFNSTEIVEFLAKVRPLESFSDVAIVGRSPRQKHNSPGAKELLQIIKRIYEL